MDNTINMKLRAKHMNKYYASLISVLCNLYPDSVEG